MPHTAGPTAATLLTRATEAGVPGQQPVPLPLPSAASLPFPLPLVLPELRVLPTALHLFMFSAITWNRHHIHYSADAARAEGHADVVVHRSLIGNYFARHAQAWMGAAGSIGRLGWRVVGPANPQQWLRCNGVVQGLAPGLSSSGGRGAVHRSADLAADPLRLRYQAWITTEGGRDVATAEGELCIHSRS